MTTYGQIFFSKENFFGAKTGDTDISLTAGLISAIYSMTAETQQQKITELELEDVRNVFNELPGEKLFIITVDKRMDISDADDMLAEMSDRFLAKYGDITMDGMILSDFEPEVDDIVADRLWYNTVQAKPNPPDYLIFLFLLASMIWYPLWLLDGQKRIIDPLNEAYDNSFLELIGMSILFGIILTGPILLAIQILKRYPTLQQPFKYTYEFLRRPTRGGYAEMLPAWFIVFPIFSMGLFFSIVRYGRGIQYGLKAQPFAKEFDKVIEQNGVFVFWRYVYLFVVLYVLTWYIILPGIVGLLTGELNWRFIKSSWILIGMSFIALLPAHIMAGLIFQENVGFHPGDPSRAADEGTGLPFLFKVTIPINLSLFIFIFLLGVGMAQLITKHKSRYPLGFGMGLFITMSIQNFIFYLIFNSGFFGFDPLFR
jgi:hypothetical protein